MEPSKEVVFSYFAGQATSVQQNVIREWLARPENRETYFQWLDEWERLFPQYAPNVAHHVAQLRHRLDSPDENQPMPIRPIVNEPRSYWTLGRWLVAASIAFAFALLTGGLLLRERLFYRTIAAGSGQLRSLKLSDGSTVALNSNSAIRIPRVGYGWLSRQVSLTGDAVFDVKHLPNDQPFVVQTADGLSIEVLGTEFSIRSHSARTEVVLKRGRVNLHYATADRPGQDVMMKPGDQVTLDAQGALQLRPQVDTTRFAQWRYRQFRFNDTPLREVARQIQNVFGVTVQLSDPALARRTLTGTIRAGSSDELAEALAELLNLHVIHRDQQLVFSTTSESQIAQ
ncbi:FecR family protein [Spirosoma validum]|uniref:FecR domain-containing protein n=1 Tax=Spirosoma validum TaxID=2771355 RepID=A0A927B2F8_9BACT|nr:FecR domain-containing protein [Spirosoma validum]MBD2754022.1 FecR domain-containing protein [Spirosoma validum]